MAIVLDGTDAIGDLGDAINAKLNLAGGKVLQVVRATDATNRSTTSTSVVDASISVTITPQKTTSSIILIHNAEFFMTAESPVTTLFGTVIIADSSNNRLFGTTYAVRNVSGSAYHQGNTALLGYATPGTTSAVTYKIRFQSNVTNMTIGLNNASTTGQLFAIEVSA